MPDTFGVDQPMSVVPAWIEAHCVVPDGFRRGQMMRLYDYQLRYFMAFYTVRHDARWYPDDPLKATAFRYRIGLLVAPQKIGKSPASAAHICVEGVGPALFAGWAAEGDVYDCAEHGCDCGWVYPYEVGEPKGMRWPTPLIQVTAYSEEQTGNIYDALRPMIDLGPLADIVPRTGEEFIRLPNGGTIETVTSSAQSRLGQRVTFVPQDEVGLWNKTNGMEKVADTQYRGVGMMGGRASLTTNAWDPSEASVAQRIYESSATDVYRQYAIPPRHLSYTNKRDRRQIHRIVYGETLRENGGHIDLDALDAVAADIVEHDPAQAARFFGNVVTTGRGAWVDLEQWDAARQWRVEPADRTELVLGFDGSTSSDHTAIRAETLDGYCFTPTYGPDDRPTIWNPQEWGGQIPRGEVNAAVEELHRRYKIVRAYCDVRDWATEIDNWAMLIGEQTVARWETHRLERMFGALTRFVTDLNSGAMTHDGCSITTRHVGNARKLAKPGDRYILGKASPEQKIDAAMAAVLAHEAAADARAAGWGRQKDRRMLIHR